MAHDFRTAILALGLATLCQSAYAAPILDQAYDPTPIDPTGGTGINQSIVASQGFTVGVSGTMVRVELLLGPPPPTGTQYTPDWLVLEIHNLSAIGDPMGEILASVTMHKSSIPRVEHWQSISLGEGFAVAEGESLALVVRAELGTAAPGTKFIWRTATSGDPYPDGLADRKFKLRFPWVR